jgi:4-hydroxybenzoyl-CoA thioesterase
MAFETTIEISFGDCDPAGIIFYPNYFRWFDAAFQAFLKTRELDQHILREKLGTIGTGLMDAGASFRAPASFGDTMALRITGIEWTDRTFRITYEGRIGERIIVEGFELRGVFVKDGDRLKAAPVAPLKDLVGDLAA